MSPSQQHILVIEDDDETRELLRLLLERLGYRVTTAEDGLRGYDEAVAAIPDLIITDIKMPAADGVNLVRHVRDTPQLARTPILVTTGYGTGHATFALTQGANAFEPKPVNPVSLIATIERLLEKSSE